MIHKKIKRALALGVMALSLENGYAALDLSTVPPLSTRTITTYRSVDGAAAAPVAGLTFKTTSKTGIVDYTENAAARTLTDYVFDQTSLRVSGSVGANAATLANATFKQDAEAPYMILDNATANAKVIFSSQPTFTGSGWIQVDTDFILEMTATMEITAPIKIADGKTLSIICGAHTITLSGIVQDLYSTGIGNLIFTPSSANAVLDFTAAPTFKGNFTHSLTAAATVQLADGIVFTPNMILRAPTKVKVVDGKKARISGIISGGFALSNTSINSTSNTVPTILELTGLNTFASLTNAGDGTTCGNIMVGSETALGAGAVTVAIASKIGVTADAPPSLRISNAITATGQTTFDIIDGKIFEYNGAITGAAGAVKENIGRIILLSTTNNPASWAHNDGGLYLGAGAKLFTTNARSLTVGATAANPVLGFLGATTLENNFVLNKLLALDAIADVTATFTTGVWSGTSGIKNIGLGTVTSDCVNTYTGESFLMAFSNFIMGSPEALGASGHALTIFKNASLTNPDGDAITYQSTGATAIGFIQQ